MQLLKNLGNELLVDILEAEDTWYLGRLGIEGRVLIWSVKLPHAPAPLIQALYKHRLLFQLLKHLVNDLLVDILGVEDTW